jgi:hypothetical protein
MAPRRSEDPEDADFGLARRSKRWILRYALAALVGAGVMLAGYRVVPGGFVGPGFDLTALRAEQRQVDSAQSMALAKVMNDHDRIIPLLEGLVRRQCLNDPAGARQAQMPCDELTLHLPRSR